MIAALIAASVLIVLALFLWWSTGCDPLDKPWLNERLARFRAGEPPDQERENVGPIPPPGCP